MSPSLGSAQAGVGGALLERVEAKAVHRPQRPGALKLAGRGALRRPGDDRSGEGVGLDAAEANLGEEPARRSSP
jgi:hypothetical protein